jgi:hypothetical protein
MQLKKFIQLREWYKIPKYAIEKIIIKKKQGPNLKGEKTKGGLDWKKILIL